MPMEVYIFTFLQASVSFAMKSGLMHKYVCASVIRGDESEPFGGVEKLASTGGFSHFSTATLINYKYKNVP